MANLHIIGNGFDLAHGMQTSYEDFHQYLKEEYPDALFDGCVPEAQMMPDGDMSYGDIDVVGFLIEVITNAEPEGEKWSDLETSLGYLDLNEYLDNYDDDDDDNEWHTVYRNEDLSNNLVGAVLEITDYFAEWINTIDINEVSPKGDFEKLIDNSKDLFLTFNYTATLEALYEAKNVCHIHGKQGGKLLFGHGNDTDYTEEYMGRHVGSENALQDMQEKLRKNTTEAIKGNQDFFNSIGTISVDRVYSFGFSFSEVDKIYITEICRRLPNANVTWYLNDFDDIALRKQYESIIKSCGFNGVFDTYHVS
ncbi:bacteriophage abortive infection AbiH family protein [Paenibacillus amylolyticus]|uniref:bacteriophage abortive infection AbiH family protein n=1 Tax=Paenibacillus amylolyticus TaxID=1451 RepID=UPI00387A1C7E